MPSYTAFLKTFPLVQISSGCYNKVAQMGQLKQQNFCSQFRGQKSEVREAAGSGSREGSLLGSHCVLVAWRECL